MARELGIRKSALYRWRDEYCDRSEAGLTIEQEKPNVAWGTDITYIPTREGWLYLAAILDVHSRKVVGGSRSERIDTQLVLDAFGMACQGRKPPNGLIPHSDRGSHYASHTYRQQLEQAGLTCSMSRKGNGWDHAVAEAPSPIERREIVGVGAQSEVSSILSTSSVPIALTLKLVTSPNNVINLRIHS